MTLDTVRLRKKVGSMKAPGERDGVGERLGFGGASTGQSYACLRIGGRHWSEEPNFQHKTPEPRAPKPSPSPVPFLEEKIRVSVGVPLFLAHSQACSPPVPRMASMRKPASSWMRSSMPRLPIPKSRRVMMEKRRSCLARSPLLNVTPSGAGRGGDRGVQRAGVREGWDGSGGDRERYN